MAVVPPMPSASVSTAVTAKTRAAASLRAAWTRSRKAVMPALDGNQGRIVVRVPRFVPPDGANDRPGREIR